jgi:hyperosmotically inducible periplasmic protein
MKIVTAFASLLLIAAGCSTYPENEYSSTYGTTTYGSYGSQPTYSRGVISSPSYRTTPSSPTYSPSVTQGAAAATQVSSEADRTLAAKVRTELDHSTLAGLSRNIYIDSRNGTVTVTGSVPTEQDRQFINNVVRNTTGVFTVVDQLQVTGAPTGAAEDRVYATTPGTPAPQVASPHSAGTIFNLHVQGLDEPDRSMAQRILQELRTDTILPSLLPMVHITVSGGIVTLEGNVQNERQRRAIETAVRRATGGQMENRLQIR